MGRVKPPLELWQDAVFELLRRTQRAQPGDLADAVNVAARPLDAEITMYLIDREQRTLRAVPRRGGAEPQPLPVEGTLAGRAFMTGAVVPVSGERWRLWVQLQDGTERLGVLEMRLPEWLDPGDPEVDSGLRQFDELVGHLVAAKNPYGDVLRRARRSRPPSTASEMLWRMLPPLTFATEHVVISAVLEPCYEVGGDAFDYAVDADVARVAVLDAVGRGLHAGLTAAVALSAMRTVRIDGQGLYAMARAADEALIGNFGDQRYATAVLAEIDLIGGSVRYLNAGHPPPVLLRGGKAVSVLDRGRRMPLGLDDPAVETAEVALEPGDRLLFHTDGFTEARDEHGEEFGVHRLVDFAERHAAAGLPVPETLRRLSHDVLAHQYGPLRDDATLLLVSWSEEESRRVLV